MFGNKIRTRAFQSIFFIACILFSGLFVFYHNFIFTSIDQIFAKQDTSKINDLAKVLKQKELKFRNSTKMLYMNRGIQKRFAASEDVHPASSVLEYLENTLHVWYQHQSSGDYISALYSDINGKPFVAVDFSARLNVTDLETNFVENSGRTQRRDTASSYIDPLAVDNWDYKTAPKTGTYVIIHPEGKQILRTVFPILNRKTREPIGFLSIDRVSEAILKWNGSKNESLLIIDKDSGIVLADDTHTTNNPHFLTQYLSTLLEIQFTETENTVPEYAKIQVDGKNVILTRIHIPDIKWDIFHATILNTYIDAPKARSRLLVLGAVIFILTAGGSIYTLTKRVQNRSAELEKANEVVSAHSKMLQQELQTAHDMQMRLMPQENPNVNGYQLVGRCRPATEVGGDFFQYFNVGEDKWTFALADVTGHGMQAAVPTMVFSGLLDAEMGYSSKVQESGRVSVEPERLMGKLNTRLCRFLEPRTFVCLSLGELDTVEHTIKISNGGCPYPYVYKAAQNTTEELDLSAFPLGVRKKSSYDVSEVSMKKGDVVVFCSDGIMEASSQHGQLFGFDRVAEIISEAGAADKSADQIIAAVFSELDEFSKGCEQDDDQTIVVVKAA